MFKNRHLVYIGFAVMAVGVGANAWAAAKSSSAKQSAIQQGTSVRTRVTPTGLYNQECYDAYFGCMDQFCITDNTNGGSCACSDDSIKYEKDYAEIQSMLENAERISTVEVEKVKAGAQADIIFTGKRAYDENGNKVSVDELEHGSKAQQDREKLLAMFKNNFEDDDDEDDDDIFNKSGAALHKAAEGICRDQVPDTCEEKDITLLRQVYARQIVADCNAFKNTISAQRREAEVKLAEAESAVRAAQKESFESANKYDLGQCMVEFKKCMQTEDACGKDWENCVFTVASENMQNNKATSTANTTVKKVAKYDITASTMEILESKRNICERVLDQCNVVRDQVWPSFLREAAPTIRIAEQKNESKFRTSCLSTISDCIQKACKDDIAGKGVDSMDACLARPDMARSFCKVEIDPCERMEPQIWSYVTDKLAAMRVDACTQEVKDCFTADTRCGADFSNCIGMDYEYIHEMCPVETLTACKKNGRDITMADLDQMLMGLYLNIDNSMLDNCQELVDKKMAEICGSTTDCNKFAADDTIGTGSIRSQKDGNVYRVTGMISFGSIKMGTASSITKDEKTKLGPGQIGVQEYLTKVREMNSAVPNNTEIIASIEEELNNIAGTINRTIEMIEQDPEIQFCVSGRSLKQITGDNKKTSARYPNLLNQVKMQIAIAALRQAQDNYNAKLNTAIQDASKDASDDLAQYMCQKMAENKGSAIGSTVAQSSSLNPPYAISYEVGAGLTAEDLKSGGNGHYESTSGLDNGSSMTRDVTAIFTRETRNCHICTTITTSSCTVKGGNWFRTKNTDCDVQTHDPVCEDIKM